MARPVRHRARRTLCGSNRESEGSNQQPGATRRTRRAIAWLASMACLLALIPGTAKADNPIVQHIYTADPAPLVYNGRVYLYTGHDEDGSTYFTMREWRVWSSADMVNWTDHGSPMSLATFSWAERQRVGRAGRLPQRQVLLVRAGAPALQRPQMAIGVGVSDSPTGPFRDALGHPLVENDEIDPHRLHRRRRAGVPVLGQPGSVVREAERRHDLVLRQPDADPAHHGGVRHPHRQREPADAVRGRPVGLQAQRPVLHRVRGEMLLGVHRATPRRPGPTGPWTYRGTIMPTQGGSFTNHAGRRSTSTAARTSSTTTARCRAAVATPARSRWRSSATTPTAPFPTINMTHDRRAAGRHAEPVRAPGGRDDRLGIGDRDRAVQRGRDERRLDRERRLHQGQGRRVRRRCDLVQRPGRLGHQRRPDRGAPGQRHRPDSSAPAPWRGTGGWQTWTTVTCPVSGATGTHDLYLRFAGGSGNLFNVNWWQFGGTGGSSATNLLTNGDVENGTTGWGVHGSGTLARNTTVAHGGSGSLSITGRTGAWNGPSQDVTAEAHQRQELHHERLGTSAERHPVGEGDACR